MATKKWLSLAYLSLLIVVFGAALFALNGAPTVPAVLPNEPATLARPFVVKIHAQWCPVCMLAKQTWTKLQSHYVGRVNLVVFDVTSKGSTETSRAEAKRLGLQEFFEAHSGEVGWVYVLAAGSKVVTDSVPGMSKLADYMAAIDSALQRTRPVPVGTK